MSDIFHIVSLDFPIDVVRKCPGVSLDIGGSVVKLVYRSKDDWKAAEAKKDASVCPLRLLTCGRPHLDAALEKVKDEAYISREEGKTTKIYSCGVGGYQENEKIKEVLDVEVENVQEGDCLIAGIGHMLSNIPMDECIHQVTPGLEKSVIDEQKGVMNAWIEMGKKSNHDFMGSDEVNIVYPEELTLSSEKSMEEVLGADMYPYVIMQLGSAYAGLIFQKDKPPTVCSMTANGGRHFMGIASFLTGIKSYNEFIDLAEKGDLTKVSQTISSLVATNNKDEDDPYAAMSRMKMEHAIFSFGHAVFQDLDNFKKEDVALAWLLSHIDDIVISIHSMAVQHGVKNFLVCGSFAIRESVRNYMVQKLAYRDCQNYVTYKKQYMPRLYFLKNGGHTGSVGAMLNSVEKFTKDRGQAATEEA